MATVIGWQVSATTVRTGFAGGAAPRNVWRAGRRGEEMQDRWEKNSKLLKHSGIQLYRSKRYLVTK